MEQQSNGESAWNLSQYLIELIGKLIGESLIAYGNGDISKAFFKWKAIRLIICSRFTEEEINKLKKIEMEAMTKTVSKKNSFGGEKIIYNNNLLSIYLEDYIETMNNLFRKYKIDIVDKEHKVRLT